MIASSSTTYVVDQLVKKAACAGNLAKKTNGNLRQYYAGRALMEKIFPSHAQKIAASFSELSSEELQQLKTIFTKNNLRSEMRKRK